MKTYAKTKTILGALAASALALTTFAASAADKEIAVIVKTANSDFWQNVTQSSQSQIASGRPIRASL